LNRKRAQEGAVQGESSQASRLDVQCVELIVPDRHGGQCLKLTRPHARPADLSKIGARFGKDMHASVHRVGHIQATVVVECQAQDCTDAFIFEQALRRQNRLRNRRSQQQHLQPS